MSEVNSQSSILKYRENESNSSKLSNMQQRLAQSTIKQNKEDKEVKCIITHLSSSEIKTQHLLANEACYHKLYQELLKELDQTEQKISEEILISQNELKGLVKEMVDLDCIRAGDDSSLLKIKNFLNINILQCTQDLNQHQLQYQHQQQQQQQSMLKLGHSSSVNVIGSNTGSSTNLQVYNLPQITPSIKEEIKEYIMEDIKKDCIANFTNDDRLVLTKYERFIPQDQDKITKSVFFSENISKNEGKNDSKQHLSLDNSYLSDINLEQQTLKESRQLLKPELYNLNFCVYDFKPVNSEFLMLQRLDYLTKQQKIKNYIRNQFRERVDEIKINNSVFVNQTQQWLTNCEIQKRTVDKQLKMRYPTLFEEFQMEQKHHTDIFNNYPGYFPHLLGAGRATHQQAEDDEDDEWDDFQRYKDNKADINLNRFRLYKQFIYQEPNNHLIKNPLEYEIEFKKRMVWNVKDIETFLRSVLENPPDFWILHKYLPHKSSKDLAYFYQAFKKLFNLKKHFQTLRVASGLPSQAVRRQQIEVIINEVMRPLLRYQQDKRNYANYDINQGNFTVQELLQIYSSISETRRRIKEQEKIIDHTLTNYHFNTFKVTDYKSEDINELMPISYFDDIERKGNRILDFCKQQLSYLNPDLTWQAQNLTAKISFYINLMQSSKQLLSQKDIKKSLEATSTEQNLLRKRKFNEHFKRTGDRNVQKLVLSKQIIEDSSLPNKRQKQLSSNIESQNFNSTQSPYNLNLSSSNVYENKLNDNNFSSLNQQVTNNAFSQMNAQNKSMSFTERYVQELNSKHKKILGYLQKKQSDQKVISPNQPQQQLQQQQLLQQQQQQGDGSNLAQNNLALIKSSGLQMLPYGELQLLQQQQQIQFQVERDYRSSSYSEVGRRTTHRVIESSNSDDSMDMDDESGNKQRKGLLQWQEDEKEKFILLLQKYGRDWNAIANELPRKTDKQCRNYFQNYKHKLNLQQYLPDKAK